MTRIRPFAGEHGAPSRAPVAGLALAATAAYAAASFSLLWTAHGGAITQPAWPSPGVALAAVLLLGDRAAVAFWVGSAAAGLTSSAPATHGGIAAITALTAVAVARLLHRYGSSKPLERVESVVQMGLYGSLGAALDSILGTTLLGLTDAQTWSQWPAIAWTWWIGDVVGVVLVTPVLLAWGFDPYCRELAGRRTRFAACMVCTALVAAFAFLGPNSLGAYIVFPLLCWSALAFEVRGAASAVFVVAALAILGALAAPPLTEGGVTRVRVPLQPFLGISAATFLLLGARTSERRHAQKDHAASEERLRIALEVSSDGLWDWNIASGEVFFNERWLEALGYSRSEMPPLVSSWERIIHPEDLPRGRAAMREHFAGRAAVYECEGRLLTRAGTYRWSLARGRVISRDAAGVPLRMIGIDADISRRKEIERERETLLAQAQAALREAEASARLRDEFLATVTHELRTPLHVMIGSAQGLQEEISIEGAARQALERIVRSGFLLSRLVTELIDASAMAAGKLRLKASALQDLAPIVADAVDVLRSAATAQQIPLEVHAEEGAGPVLGDPDRIHQIVWNLVSNAIKFNRGTGGLIQVSVRRVGGMVQISVRDDGQGIEPAFIPHVFDRFRQADGSTARLHGGMGLGLAIVRHLVELHGGSICAESAGPGHGATFTVSLPLLAERADSPRLQAAPDSGEPSRRPLSTPPLSGLQVLVVDDDRDALAVIRKLLERRGATVTTTDSAPDALAHLGATETDVLIADISMPEHDGYWLIQRVRELSGPGRRVSAIALTAAAHPLDRSRALQEGFDYHAAKPIAVAALVEIVATAAQRAAVGGALDS